MADEQGVFLGPLVEVAKCKFTDTPTLKSKQDDAEDIMRQIGQTMHHNISYAATLIKGERSKALAEWNAEFRKRYRKDTLRRYVSCHRGTDDPKRTIETTASFRVRLTGWGV